MENKENRAKTLLIIDDAEYNIELLTDVFSGSYNIMSARSGKAGLDIMQNNIGKIDVVLLDIVMPEMDGYQVLLEMNMNEDLKYIPVIVITANDDPESEHQAFDYGAFDYITRPFNLKTLKYRVNSVFHKIDLDRTIYENEQLKKAAETERRLSALMDNLPGGVAIISTNGDEAKCTYFNSPVPKLLHMSEAEFSSAFVKKDGEEYPNWIRQFIEHAKTEVKFDFPFCVKSDGGDEVWARMIASALNEEDGHKSLYCVFLDISAEKTHEKRADEADKKLRKNRVDVEKLINSAPGGITLSEKGEDGKMHTLYSSRGLADIFGYPDYETYVKEVEQGKRRMISNVEADGFRSKMSNSLLTGMPIEYTFNCQDYSGKPIWIMVNAQFLKSEAGRLRLYCFITNVTKEKTYEIELKNNAYYDPLTGLFNRSAFFLNAKEVLSAHTDKEYVIYRVNIGSFKLINDIMGREVGDKMLTTIAFALRELMPSEGVLARFFADNFVMLMPQGTVSPEEIIEAIKKSISGTEMINHDVQYYVGVYTITNRNANVEDMCDRASIACRSISGSFSNHVAYYDKRMRDEMLEEQEIRDETHSAIAGGQFCIYYQPVYGLRSKKFVSAEALVRWKHPTKGIISPGKFIPMFERNGFIAELDLYVLEQVCKYQQKRRKQGLEPFPISVNISRMSLYNPRLFDIISDLTEKYGVEPKYFRIEITETAYNDNPAQLLDTVNRLREKCYPVLMDDFGSGYSSLNTLKDIPIDLLKLDMKFMQGFESNDRVGTIVTAVARMAKWLNIPMLAEGVETKEQYVFLESIGCAYIQGYYFSKPIPEEEFTELIQSGAVNPSDTVLEKYGMGEEVNELLGSNATLTKLISGAFGGLGIYELSDDKLEVIRVNEGYMQIMGYSPMEFTGEHFNIWEKVHPDDIEKSKNACLEAARTDTAVRARIRRYNKDGKLMHLDGIHRRLGGTDENPIFCIAFNDITDQLEQESLIEQSRRQIEYILDATGAMVVDVDYIKEQTFCKGDLDAFDLTEEELNRDLVANKSFESIVHPDDLPRLKEWHKIKSEQRITEEFRLKKKDGQYHWCRISEIQTLDKSGNMTRKIGFLTDISEERGISDQLETTRELMDSTMKNISAGVLMVQSDRENKHSKILYANDIVWKLTGTKLIDPDTDFFRVLEKAIHPDDKGIFEKHMLALEDKKTKQSINIRVHKTGDDAWSWIRLSTTYIDGYDRICVVISDISDLKSVTSQLETLVDNAPCGIAMFEKKNNYDMIPLFVGKNYYSVTGMRKSRPFDFYQSVHPEDLVQLQNEIQKGGTIHSEYRVIKEEGEAWLELTAALTDAFDDTKQLYMVILTDVTEKRKATARLEAIIDNLESGIGLINDCNGKLSLNYSNDKFLSVLNIANTSKARFSKVLSEVVDSPPGNSDIIISMPDKAERTVRIHLAEFEDNTQKGSSYIVTADDVTLKRAQGKSRIEERKANAANGNYDEVFEIDYNEKTTRMITSRRHPERVKNAKKINLENVLLFWVDKYIHPDDKKNAVYMFAEPMRNADFTDAYVELRIRDPEDEDNYKRFGLVLVRSEGDFCMLFLKNIEGKEELPSIEEVRELDRLYKQVALQTNTTVVEYNHLTDTTTCSDSIKNFAAGYLSEENFKKKENYVNGLAIHAEDIKDYHKFLKDAENTDEISSVILRMKMTDGEYKWCRLSLSYVTKPNGDVVKSLCTINEVDGEIQALQKLDEKSEMLNRTVRNVPAGVGIYEMVDGKIVPTYVSDKTYELFGLDTGEIEVLSSYIEKIEEPNTDNGAVGDKIYPASRKDGSSFWLNIRYKVVNEGGKIYIYATMSDVSERVEQRQKQEIQEQLYQMLLEETGTIIFDYDPEKDSLSYYMHFLDEEKSAVVIENLRGNTDNLNKFDKANREEFNSALDRLQTKDGTDEIPLMIYYDGFPRHFRGFFKSIADSTGKISRIIGKIDDVDDEVARINEIKAKAMYDPLCVEIYNRATTEELIRSELQRSVAGALLMIDVDDFKSINDLLGHMFGDEFLKQFAAVVKGVFRETDIVGRYGGDEFFVFLNHANSALAVRKGNEILKRVADIQVPQIGTVKSSIGIAMVNPETRSYVQLMKQADSALYEAKNKGKNQVVLFDSGTMNESVFRTALPTAGRNTVHLSSNPNASSLIMRVFSALYSSGDIKSGINQMLAFAGKHFDVSRAYIFEDSDDGLYCSNTFEWCNEGVKSEKDTLQNVSYAEDLDGNYKEKFNDEGIFYCHDVKELDDSQREILERQGVKSVLQCIIAEDGKFKGFVGFDECRDNRFWTQEQVDALAYISKILGSFLLYERNKIFHQHYSRSLETILMQYPEYIYIIEPETHKLLYVNRMIEDALGENKKCLGLCCYDVFCGDKNFSDCPVRELVENGLGKPVEMLSPLLKKRLRTQAAVVEWNGKKAYMVSCLYIE